LNLELDNSFSDVSCSLREEFTQL